VVWHIAIVAAAELPKAVSGLKGAILDDHRHRCAAVSSSDPSECLVHAGPEYLAIIGKQSCFRIASFDGTRSRGSGGQNLSYQGTRTAEGR
jgi:hypothetical protein